jgi:S-formylglutathione hydrolase FrmB
VGSTPRLLDRRTFLGAAAASAAALAAGCASSPAAAPSTSPTGATDVPAGPGPLVTGRFRSRYRRTTVGWAISYPPGHGPGDAIPSALVLHGFGADHSGAFGALKLQDAQAQTVDGRPLAPLALAAVDGGNGYWHPRADGDDPQGMLVHEFLPLLASRRLDVRRVGVLGWSMGGYGALLLAEAYPHLVRRVAAESPAIWPSFAASQVANPSAFDSARDWADHDVIGHVAELAGIPVRVDEGASDPFLWGSERLQELLPAGSVHFEPGGHTDAFWQARGPAQLQFLTAGLPG